ncbi:HD domain-containing protein [bacterium]|nr:HD domain-containing protein [bacterium]
MTKNENEQGVSLFSKSLDLLEDDPLEEIFALNLGDFVSEHFISKDLAAKIGKKDKTEGLKNQLKELISIYSLDNTLCVLGFTSKEDYVIYNSIAKTIIQMVDVDACHIYLNKINAKGLDRDDLDLILVGSSIEFDGDIYSHHIGYKIDDKNIVCNSFINREIIEADKLSHPNKILNEENVKNVTVIPMHSNTNSVGVIVLESYENKVLNKEYVNLIDIIAKLFSTSLNLQKMIEEVSNLIERDDTTVSELQHLRAELTALIGDLGDHQQIFVKHLASAVDVKGQYKTSHSQNTADLAKSICRELSLNEKTSDLIYYAGLLQNIGKITLPEKIFNQKGTLSSEDWKQLQKHPNVGINILMNINFLSEVIPYIHYHRERYDGSGEPEGLKSMSIPLGSRIIAVADAYSAMTTDRPYRKALSKEEALDIIRKESGTKWDPVVVNALEQVEKN